MCSNRPPQCRPVGSLCTLALLQTRESVQLQTLQGLEMTLEILADMEARSSESLAALGRGEPGADIATARQDLARRRATGT